jgi:hypothetical protein
VIVREAGATTSEIVADIFWAGLAESATLAVKLNVPAAVGVPEITPVVDDRVRPAGRVPEVIDQV